MSHDFFDRLDDELAGLTRQGAHLTAGIPAYRRAGRLIRRGAVTAVLALALAAALVSEFPASASGHAQAAGAATARPL